MYFPVVCNVNLAYSCCVQPVAERAILEYANFVSNIFSEGWRNAGSTSQTS